MKWLISLLLLFWIIPGLWGQTPSIDTTVLQTDAVQVLQTYRGDIFFGRTLSIDSKEIKFRIRELDPISFARGEVRWLGPLEYAGWLTDKLDLPISRITDESKVAFDWEQNLAYSMTAFPYGRGGGEYRNISILYNTVEVGLTDYLSIGGGTILPILFNVRARASFRAGEQVHLGVGTNSFLGFDTELGTTVSHFFGMATFGSPRQYFNITAGKAWDWDFPEDSPFILTAGGNINFGTNWRVYADVGFSPGNDGIIPTLLISWFKKRNRLEIGLLGIPDDIIGAFPLVGYARRF